MTILIYRDVDTVIMFLGTSPNPLISSTTAGLEINKRRCIVAQEEKQDLLLKKLFMLVEMQLQGELQ